MRARKNRMDIIRPGRGVEVRSVANSFEELRAEVKRLRAGFVIHRKTDFLRGPQAKNLRPFSFFE